MKQELKKLYTREALLLMEGIRYGTSQKMTEQQCREVALLMIEKLKEVTHSDERATSKFDREYWVGVEEVIKSVKM